MRLSECILKHTGGNPFFVEAFVKGSVELGLMFYNFEKITWDWDEDQISKLKISDNIVEYLIESTLKNTLREDNIEVLKAASCFSTREFNTFILSRVVGLSPKEVTARLWPAVMSGLLETNDERFVVFCLASEN